MLCLIYNPLWASLLRQNVKSYTPGAITLLRGAMPTAVNYALKPRERSPQQMGTLVIVAFPHLMKFLNFLKPKPAQPTIDCYGQLNSRVEPEQIQSLMEWLES